jgi:hypothetical protein
MPRTAGTLIVCGLLLAGAEHAPHASSWTWGVNLLGVTMLLAGALLSRGMELE